ncbi:hypothetical protein, partial [Pseudonocardia xinjiangensis]|uniref:hypothetical protein n=1 Tax=Pseudonocardia xinjiangensis TaxID=75289 RepID=UPI001B7D1315
TPTGPAGTAPSSARQRRSGRIVDIIVNNLGDNYADDLYARKPAARDEDSMTADSGEGTQ